MADPSGYGVMWLTAEEINAEASGYFLIPAGVVRPDFVGISQAEAGQVFGRASSCPPEDPEDTGCPGDGGDSASGNQNNIMGETNAEREAREQGGGGPPTRERPRTAGDSGFDKRGTLDSSCSDCGGLPAWTVSEPYLNLWIHDVPLHYTPSKGPAVTFALSYKQRDEGTGLDNNVSQFGQGWNSSWISQALDRYGPSVYLPGGGKLDFTFPEGSDLSDPHYRNNSQLEKLKSGEVVTGLILHFPDGSQLKYTHAGTYAFHLTEQIDPQGNKLTFNYGGTDNTVTSITDADGNVTYLYYENSNLPNYVTKVVAPGSREVVLSYSDDGYGNGQLTNLVDVVGISSSFTYDATTAWPESMTTPYGTTSFTIDYVSSYVDRSIIITEPNGGKQVYMLLDASGTNMPSGFQSSQFPTNTPFATNSYPYGTLDVTNRNERNTFYWNPDQFASLSTTNLANFTWAELKRARIRHWLWRVDGISYHLDRTIGHEQAPSPDDGTTEGQITWFDYDGKSYTSPEIRGSQVMPAVIARVMPDTTTWWTRNKMNVWGTVTNTVEKWYVGANANYRTNRFIYDSTGIDLFQHRFDPDGANKLVVGYGYDGSHPHQPVRMTNALGEITYYTYDASHRLSTVETPADLLSTYTYGTDGYLQKIVDSFVGGSALRTNSFTWLNGNLRPRTDERGLTITNTWDKLNRLTQIDYPDTTYIKHAYTNGSGAMLLDRTFTKDRLGLDTRYEYNSFRQLTKVTDPRTNITAYSYCDCGGLEYIVNAFGTALAETNHFVYDYQGKRVETYLPDGTSVTNQYDLLGRLSVISDALGKTTNTFDNLNRLVAVSNYFGRVQSIAYDVEDQATNIVDANGVSITNTFDNLGRLLTRTYPDGGVEKFGYTANVAAMTSYTNQLTNVWLYAYDATGRKTNELAVGMYTNSFTYKPAGELLTLKDGKNQVTTWNYDEYGRVTNKLDQASVEILRYKYDADSRLTNRWSKAKLDTAYSYDAAGNLTLVNYPSGTTDITLSHDALNRTTNMVDAAGTTKYTYTAGGNLLTEDGPWSSDTVTHTYHATAPRLRTALSLQQPTGTWTNGFGYDAARRLTNVTSTAGAFSYAYKGVGTLVQKLSLPNTSYITNVYDTVARLTSTKLNNSGNTNLNKHEYLYNAGNQRIRHTRTGDSYYTNTYDNIGQLKVADSTVASEDRFYGYDAGWNLNKRTNNTTVYTFTVDNKNQLTNGPAGSNSHDDNGNMTSYSSGYVTYAYDAENQFVTWQNYNTAKTDFVYDGRGRLRKRLEYTWMSSPYNQWSSPTETRYIYDGMRVIQERNSGNTPTIAYTRGSDLSGSLEGAGGIGGLLARSHQYTSGSLTNNNYYHADGGGNVTYLVNTNQANVATYKYDPFGNTISLSGSLASANVYRFSSKEVHANTGMYYYGYRFYDPNLQRWLNRDPLLERGGINLHRFAKNRPEGIIDSDGRFVIVLPFILYGGGSAVGADLVLIGGGMSLGFGLSSLFPPASSSIFAPPLGNSIQNAPPSTATSPFRCDARGGAGSGLPITGTPNTSAAADNGDGTGTIRNYGPDGKAVTDHDIGHDHTGAGDPHAHDWNWTGPKPVREPPRPLNPNE